ncbi:MAG TPA: NAD(P)H-dependent oxidoreductase [Syntrophomonadaceae bacterium]|nr:NAD(P)H-dependent oxidoreductase [Syntrophomonadaceae bacterium]
MDEEKREVKILGMAGSLRRGSFNKAALRAAGELLPPDAHLEIIDLAEIPFFNEDLEGEPLPEAVLNLAKAVQEADALLLSTPEYNYSVPPVLKNAIDWVSRPSTGAPANGKPVAIISASPGMFGGARAQYHLRQVCVVVNMLPLNKPEVFIMQAHTKFDQDLKLIDAYTRNAISGLLQALVAWTRLLKGI